MNATHLRIISCPREGGEMTGYNPDQQPKCRLTESAFRDECDAPPNNFMPPRGRRDDWVQPGPATEVSVDRKRFQRWPSITGAVRSRTSANSMTVCAS